MGHLSRAIQTEAVGSLGAFDSSDSDQRATFSPKSGAVWLSVGSPYRFVRWILVLPYHAHT